MSTQMDSVLYQDIPQNKLQAKMLTNWSPMDKWLLSMILLSTVATFVWVYRSSDMLAGGLVLIFVEPMLLALLLRANNGWGRVYREIYRGMKADINHSLENGVIWKADDSSSHPIVRWIRRRRGNRPPLPFGLSEIEAKIDGTVHQVGIEHQLDRPYDHVVISAQGGAMSRLDSSMQFLAVTELADIVNQVIAQSGLKVGVTFLRMTSPLDEGLVFRIFAGDGKRSNINPVIASPDSFVLDEDTRAWALDMQQTLNELRPTLIEQGAGTPLSFVILTIKRDKRKWSRARAGKLTDTQLYDLPVVEMSRSLADGLSSSALLELTNVQVLGLGALARKMRIGRDVVDIQSYYRELADGTIPPDKDLKELTSKIGGDAVMKALKCFPQEIIQALPSKECLRVDNNYFVFLRFTQLPKRIRPDQMQAIHYMPAKGMWTRFAAVGQSASGSMETRAVDAQSAFLTQINNAFSSNKIIPNRGRRRKQASLDAQAEVMSANSIGQQFNDLYGVVADTERKAVKQAAYLAASLARQGFKAEVVRGPHRLFDCFISCCYGANRL